MAGTEELKPEVTEKELEVLPPEADHPTEPITEDAMDAFIAVAGKVEPYAKAMDMIMNTIIKRSYAKDWVCHAKESAPEEAKSANIGSAAAERIATFLGIQEKDWKGPEKVWSEDRKHFTYVYEANFGFKGRWVHAIGQAGTRDKFFGFAKGDWKALADVEEDDIRMAAFRACRKEGVRSLFGLRQIPILKLKELGYDITKIAYASYEDKGKALSADQKKTDEKGLINRKVKIKAVNVGWTGPKNKRFDVTDNENVKYSFFATETSKRYAILTLAKESGELVDVLFRVKEYNGNEQYEIVQVNGQHDGDK